MLPGFFWETLYYAYLKDLKQIYKGSRCCVCGYGVWGWEWCIAFNKGQCEQFIVSDGPIRGLHWENQF